MPSIVSKEHHWQCKSGWWFQIFFISTPIWGRFLFWQAGLVQPPTRNVAANLFFFSCRKSRALRNFQDWAISAKRVVIPPVKLSTIRMFGDFEGFHPTMPWMVYLPTWMVDLITVNIGKYPSPTWVFFHSPMFLWSGNRLPSFFGGWKVGVNLSNSGSTHFHPIYSNQ